MLASLWSAECLENPRTALDVNVIGVFNVMQASQEIGILGLVYACSAVVHDDPVAGIITEDSPLNGCTMYGATEITAAGILRAGSAQNGLPHASMHYPCLYGPRQMAKGEPGGVLIHVLDRIAAGDPPVIHGDGSESFDSIDVCDVARAMCLALRSDGPDGAFNVASGVSISTTGLDHLLLGLTASSLQPEYVLQTGSPGPRTVFSTERACTLLGYQAQTSCGPRGLVHWRTERNNTQ